MDVKIKKAIEQGYLKQRPNVKVGDRVKVNVKIQEKGKTRIQVFEGVVIAIKGSGISKTFTVRKISYGVGVEKIFPFHSPTIDSIEIIKRGKVRQSKLYYMRDRVGKRSMKIKNAQEYVDDVSASESVSAQDKASDSKKEEIEDSAE
jgi:large subunit ribosomal protein L19